MKAQAAVCRSTTLPDHGPVQVLTSPQNVAARESCQRRGNTPGAGQNSSVVAQDCILLYRGFPIRRPLASPAGVENPAPSRLETGDTAEAVSKLATKERRNRKEAGILCILCVLLRRYRGFESASADLEISATKNFALHPHARRRMNFEENRRAPKNKDAADWNNPRSVSTAAKKLL